MGNGLRVLVVDDETGLADLYAAWLEDDYRVETAYSGSEGLELVDEDTDVVLLDRRMPRTSGDEVLAEIRDRGLDCRVAVVTAVDADFDIIEMPFDEYLSKPVSEDDLREVIERLTRRATYDEALRRYFSLVSRRAALEAEKEPAELRSSDEYQELVDKIESTEDNLDRLVEELGEADAAVFFSEFDRP